MDFCRRYPFRERPHRAMALLKLVGLEAQAVDRCAPGEADPGQRRPEAGHQRVQPRFRTRRRIGGDDVEAAAEEQGGPAGADHAGADHRDAADLRLP